MVVGVDEIIIGNNKIENCDWCIDFVYMDESMVWIDCFCDYWEVCRQVVKILYYVIGKCFGEVEFFMYSGVDFVLISVDGICVVEVFDYCQSRLGFGCYVLVVVYMF